MPSQEFDKSKRDDLRSEFLKDLPTFTLEIGGKSGSELLEELLLKGVPASPNVSFMLNSNEFIPSNVRERQTFTQVSVSKILGRGGTTQEINDSLGQLGFSVCPRESAAELMIQQPDVAKGVWITVFTRPIQDQAGADCFFVVSEKHGIKASVEYPPDTDPDYNPIPWAGETQVLICLS